MFSPSVDEALAPPLSPLDISHLRADLGEALPAHKALALLDLGMHRSRLLVCEGAGGHPHPVYHHMLLGIEALTEHTFKRAMPTEARLEQGIMLVEEAVMPIVHLLPAQTVLFTCDPYLLAIGQLALGWHEMPSHWTLHGHPPILRLDAVEVLFEQLMRQAARPQIPLGDLPQSPSWAAALLILREALHHWQLDGVRLLPVLPHSPSG